MLYIKNCLSKEFSLLDTSTYCNKIDIINKSVLPAKILYRKKKIKEKNK